MVWIARQVIGGNEIGVELRPVVIVIQASCIIVRDSPLSAEFSTVALPRAVDKTITKSRLRIVIPIVHTTPKAVAGVFNKWSSGICGIDEYLLVRLQVAVSITCEPQLLILCKQRASGYDGKCSRNDKAVEVHGYRSHDDVIIAGFQHGHPTHRLTFTRAFNIRHKDSHLYDP